MYMKNKIACCIGSFLSMRVYLNLIVEKLLYSFTVSFFNFLIYADSYAQQSK